MPARPLLFQPGQHYSSPSTRADSRRAARLILAASQRACFLRCQMTCPRQRGSGCLRQRDDHASAGRSVAGEIAAGRLSLSGSPRRRCRWFARRCWPVLPPRVRASAWPTRHVPSAGVGPGDGGADRRRGSGPLASPAGADRVRNTGRPGLLQLAARLDQAGGRGPRRQGTGPGRCAGVVPGPDRTAAGWRRRSRAHVPRSGHSRVPVPAEPAVPGFRLQGQREGTERARGGSRGQRACGPQPVAQRGVPSS